MQKNGFIVGAHFKGFAKSTIKDANADTSTSTIKIDGTSNKISVAQNETVTKSIEVTAKELTVIDSGTLNGGDSDTKPSLTVDGDSSKVVISKDVTVSNYDLNLSSNSTLVIEEGASVEFNNVTIGEGATIVGNYKKVDSTSRSARRLNANNSSTVQFNVTGDITITGEATLDSIAIKGRIFVNNTSGKFTMKNCYYVADGARSGNAYLPISTNEVEIVNNEFVLDNGLESSKAVYNFIEFNYGSYPKIKSSVISGNTFDCTSMTHNVINMYAFEDYANIDITNNTYKNDNFVTTQPVRLSNVNKAIGVRVDVSGTTLVDSTNNSETDPYSTIVLFQDDSADFSQNMSTFTLIARNISGLPYELDSNTAISYSEGVYYKGCLGIYDSKATSSKNSTPVPLNIISDSTKYTSVSTEAELKEAVKEDGYVELKADLTLSSTVSISKNVIVNLNGHNVSAPNMAFESTGSNANVTINNGKITGKWVLESRNEGTLTLNNLDVTAQEFCVTTEGKGTTIINSGTYTSKDNAVLGTQGTKGNGGSHIIVNGGTFNGNIQSKGYIACGIYVANSDVVEVNAGTFNITNGVGILARSGETTVSSDVVFNLTHTDGGITEGWVGDSKITVPTMVKIYQDLAANYPGGTPIVHASGVVSGEQTANKCYIVSTETELQNALANEDSGAKYIILNNDITVSHFNLGGDVTIVGNGATLKTSDAENINSGRMINIYKNTVETRAQFVSVNLQGPTSGGYNRIIGYSENVDMTIIMDDCTASCLYYPIYSFGDNYGKTDLIIRNTTIEGYMCACLKDSNTTATFENCTLIGKNKFSTSESNGCYNINLEEKLENCVLNFKNCKFDISTNKPGNNQYYLAIWSDAEVTLENCTFFDNGTSVSLDDIDSHLNNICYVIIDGKSY